MFKNLKAEMVRYDISVSQIAETLNVSERTAKNYINGTTKISWLDVLKIQKVLFPEQRVAYLFEIDNIEKKIS
ncbi:helix-turn-helix domain-containing protein [Clostridium sardiniense]|uniref:Helix-turn-helix domain-containing protein n=1 Tax=Clostridium sardiniense TaxID=29369 RepID=A0ABS7L1K8_CLOSR|nr:helix-turn-helix transcriptional regulator [Clostridium sardiniense]MBY0756946.1 helix-turn-helix domain-containing protein [Clostridium sardiniense]MBY0756970.1 helix-turn-helix domain-containing protein [Clostridium sardiniense]MDQ0460367.1 plasmid maintenance system antidote protein VapI [Clostridium sardiniense]